MYEFIGSEVIYFGKVIVSSLFLSSFKGFMLEVFFNGDNYINILVYIYCENYCYSNLKFNIINEEMVKIVEDFLLYISSKGSFNY